VVGDQHDTPAALFPRKTQNPLCRKQDVLQGQRGLYEETRHIVTGSLYSQAYSESLYKLRCPGRRIYMCDIKQFS
jgi:hypothetical protein